MMLLFLKKRVGLWEATMFYLRSGHWNKFTCYHKQVAWNFAEKVNFNIYFDAIKLCILHQTHPLWSPWDTTSNIIYTNKHLLYLPLQYCIFVIQKKKTNVMNIRTKGLWQDTMTTFKNLVLLSKKVLYIYHVYVYGSIYVYGFWFWRDIAPSCNCTLAEGNQLWVFDSWKTSLYSLLICSLAVGHKFWQDSCALFCHAAFDYRKLDCSIKEGIFNSIQPQPHYRWYPDAVFLIHPMFIRVR